MYCALVIASTIFIPSCNKAEDTDTVTKNGIALEVKQEVPALTVVGTSSVDVSYKKSTKTLTFTARWTGMTDSVSGMHFHGPADPGVNTGVLVPITNYPLGFAGTVSGSVVLNGTTQKEEDLLGNK